MSECRSGIIKTYAEWTVVSALRSGSPVKSRKDVHELLQAIDFDVLLGKDDHSILTEEFDKWHQAATKALCDQRHRLCTGWAAKMLNVYLKTAVYVGGLGRDGLVAVIHPPIDSGLWSGLERKFSGQELLKKTHIVQRIKDICDYDTYSIIVAGCHLATKNLGCLLIEVEQLWDPNAHKASATAKRSPSG